MTRQSNHQLFSRTFEQVHHPVDGFLTITKLEQLVFDTHCGESNEK